MVTNRIDNKTPFMAILPAEHIKCELQARGMSKKELASRMEIQQSNVSRLLRGETPITLRTAEKLERAFDIDKQFWLNLQARYNEDTAAIESRNELEEKAINEEKMLASFFNMKEIYERLGINIYMFVQKKLEKLKSIFGVQPLEMINMITQLHGAFKKSMHDTNEINLNTWIMLAQLSAMQNAPSNTFKHGNAASASTEIARRVHENNLTESDIKDILSSNGISYSVVKKLDKTPGDGYSTWVNGYPSIVTTHRYNDMAMLIFTILHELGHIELHLSADKNISYISTTESYTSDDSHEKEANRFAEEKLISDKAWNDIMKSSSVGIASWDIMKVLKAKAKQYKFNWYIVLWRYRHDTNIYAIKGIKPNPIK